MSENEVLERRIQLSRLYDLYGPLLTERQRRVYEMHDLDDLSLSEIADDLGISRQGVSDQLQRARDRLDEIETLLGHAESFRRIEDEARAICDGENPQQHAAAIVEACAGRTMNHV
ncbi:MULTISPECIES: sigma-70 family RNA polymerase sigma factor [unclassified Pyramidobacter]|uniref:sigma-70 family RNA polymerase sigma factor n=1 Tax=unclassified Pyramidobacter TaxID=2632171 RepID=UPI0025E2F4D5|nr:MULTISPECIES: sigma-70 family RNA polymerase sigma factor [unclassified Pyramidobacter]MCI7402479.1 sigma-70 family RNA polymerase sigma factor [Pyramidobacter sp.]MDY3211416.1 sigma-70 family RNA polymerase sigma factor [Pyramidobacter sp.]WOL39629.1 sigma-70 family RNA polymerase sigma factor [Pyramidobacter sp. YE332]